MSVLVDGAMMASTERGEVGEGGGPALRPAANVMALDERHAAAGEPTAAVAMVQRAPKGRRNRPRPRADFHDSTVRIVLHDDPCRIARQAPGRFCGDVRAAIEHGLASLL